MAEEPDFIVNVLSKFVSFYSINVTFVEYPKKDLISFLMDLRITRRTSMEWQTTCKLKRVEWFVGIMYSWL